MFKSYRGKHRILSEKSLVYQGVVKASVRKKRRGVKIFFFVLLISLFLVGSVFGYFKYVEGKMQFNKEELKKIREVTKKREKKENVNILVLGSDSRGESGARSDTIIFLRLNPEKQMAYLVSIPRDSRVSIPEHGVRKINAAYSLGGPSLAIKTVQNLLGLPIHHYIEVDFQGFKHLVDTIGGVWVNVEKPIRDHFDGKSQVLKSGYQKLNGTQALIYVRTRKDPTGDFARMERQQNFLKALLKEVCQLKSTFKIPKLVSVISEHIKTDMSLSQMISLANEFRNINEEKLETVTLPGESRMINGASYVILDGLELERIVYCLKNNLSFEEGGEKISNSDIKVKVLNGCGVAGIATKYADELTRKGFVVVETGNALRMDYKTTAILYAKDNYKKARRLSAYFPGCDLVELEVFDPFVDCVIIIGSDYGRQISTKSVTPETTTTVEATATPETTTTAPVSEETTETP